MLKNILNLCLLAVISIALTACGGGGSTINTETSDGTIIPDETLSSLTILHSSSETSAISDIVIVDNSSISFNKANDLFVLHTAEGEVLEYHLVEGNITRIIIDGYEINYSGDKITTIHDADGTLVFENINIAYLKVQVESKIVSKSSVLNSPSFATSPPISTDSEDKEFIGDTLGILQTPAYIPGTVNVSQYPEWVNSLTDRAKEIKESVTTFISDRLEITSGRVQSIVDGVGAAGEYIVETFQNIDISNIDQAVDDVKEYLSRTNGAALLDYLNETLLHDHPIGSDLGEDTDSDGVVDILDDLPTTPNETTGTYIVFEYYGSGAIWYEAPYVNGVLEGTGKRYYESSALQAEIPYANGVIEGIHTWYYESGTPRIETSYVNGVKEGIQIWYNPDGMLKHSTTYVSDVREGIHTTYDYSTGNVYSETPYVNGVIHGTLYIYNVYTGSLVSTSLYIDGVYIP